MSIRKPGQSGPGISSYEKKHKKSNREVKLIDVSNMKKKKKYYALLGRRTNGHNE